MYNIFSLQEMGRSYARMYDLSRSDPDKICELVSHMLIGGASLDTINELLLLASRQKPQKGRVGKILQETLRIVLESFRSVDLGCMFSFVLFTYLTFYTPLRFTHLVPNKLIHDYDYWST